MDKTQEDLKLSKWVVDIKGGPSMDNFEISVIRDDNKHGKASYGWFNQNKILVSQSGGPCRDKVTRHVWDKLLTVAQEVADELNNNES